MTGEPGQTFSLETSENLVTWSALDELTSVSGSTTYRDTRAVGPSQRYYRLMAVPGQ